MVEKFLNGLKAVNRVLGYVSGALVLASAFVMLYDVILRYVFHSPSIRAPFLAAFLMLGAIFIGAAHTLFHGGHVNVEILIDKFSAVPKRICLSLGYIMSIVFMGYLTRACFNFAVTAARDGWRAMGHLPVPMVYLYGIMVFGSSMLMLALFAKLCALWTTKEGNS